MMSDTTAGPDWSGLPGEVLGVIAHRFLIKLKDFIRFQAVCKPWRRALVEEEEQQKPRFRQSIPWLMLPYCRNLISDSAAMAGCKGTDNCRCFYDVTEQKFYHIEVEMPEGFINRNRVPTCCRGSSFGWVFMLQRAPSLILFNPLTGDRINLPPITAFPDVVGFRPDKIGYEYRLVSEYKLVTGKSDVQEKMAHGKMFMERHYIKKVALSAEPTSEECVVMVIHAPLEITLAFCRPNDDDAGWTVVPHNGDDYGLGLPPPGIGFADVVFWRGQFYAVDDLGTVYVCEISNSSPPKLSKFADDSCWIVGTNSYLVTSPDGGALMRVIRDVIEPDDDDDKENHFDCETYHIHGRGLNEAQCRDGADSYVIDHDEDEDEDGGDIAAAAPATATTTEYQWPTGEFKVYKLNEDIRGWVEVESIDGFAIFLGFNTATCVSTTDHPELGLTPNSIYYTDDMTEYHCKHKYGGSDMGIYNLATRTIQPLYSTSLLHPRPEFISTLPLWILPSNY